MSAPRQTTAPVGGVETFDFNFERAALLLTDAAARAGAAIMKHYHEGLAVETKGDQSPVTRADHDSEEIILEALGRLAPEISVISEESCSAATGPLPSRFFLVDPLDGTKEFIKRRNDFTVNVALVENARPVFGLVYAPARSLLAVTLARGKAIEAELAPNSSGAELGRLQQRTLCVRDPNRNGLTALVSHSHLDPETEAFLSKLIIAERSGVGSSVKFIAIAKGEADVYPRFAPTMEWDTAAGQAVLEAAGGTVVTRDGEPLHYGKTESGLRNPSFIAWGAKNPS